MLQKGFDLILIKTIGVAINRLLEDEEIELVLCDLELPDGTALDLLHTMWQIAEMFQMENSSPHFLPFFILTEGNDITMEYQCRDEGVDDYITAPVNISELIQRVLFFVEWAIASNISLSRFTLKEQNEA